MFKVCLKSTKKLHCRFMRFMKAYPVLNIYSYGKLNWNFGRCSAGGSSFMK